MNIGIFIKMIRNLDNRITINCLALDLGVSESTINRCLSGRWSNSVKLSKVCSAVETYLSDFYGNDAQKLFDNIRSFFRTSDIPFDRYEQKYNEGGLLPTIELMYEDAYYDYVNHKETKTQPDTALKASAPISAASNASKRPEEKLLKYAKANWLYLFVAFLVFVCAVIAFDSVGITLSKIYFDIISLNPAVFALFVALLAISKTIAGLTVDTAVAKHRYKKRTGSSVPADELEYVIKFGGCHSYVQGEGRYARDREHVIFTTLCNIVSGIGSILMFKWVNEISQYYDLRSFSHIDIIIPVTLVIAVISSLIFNFFTQAIDIPSGDKMACENPDTYRLNRINVICDLLHLLFTQFFAYSSIVLCLTAVTVADISVSAIAILLVLVSNSFFALISYSPYAHTYDSACAGEKVIFSPVVCLIAFYIFINSPKNAGAITLLVIALAILIANIYFIILDKKGNRTINKFNPSSILAMVVIILIFILICFV